MTELLGLGNLFRGHYLRLIGFAVAAVPKNLAGNSLLYYEVSHLGINKYLAHAMNQPAVAAFGFATSLILWHTRRKPVKRVRRGLTKVEIGMICAGQAVFATLCGGLGLPYMAASVFNMLVLGLVHYALLDNKVFAKKKTEMA